jgi:hypothetical protein
MTTAKKIPKFDISLIDRSVEFEAGNLGLLKLNLQTADFLKWFETGEKDNSWNDGLSFVRQLLKARCEPCEDKEPVPASDIEALDGESLEAIARNIGKNSNWVLGLTKVSDGNDENLAMTECEALYKAVDQYAEGHNRLAKTRLKEMNKTIGRIMRPFGTMEAAFGRIDKIRDEMTIGLPQKSLIEEMTASRLATRSLLGDHRLMGLGLVEDNKAFSRLTGISDDVMSALGGSLFGGISEKIVPDTIFSRTQNEIASILGRSFHLGSEMSALKTLREDLVQPRSRIADMLGGDAGPSVLSAAYLSLQGLGPKGAVADLLKQHIDPVDIRPLSPFDHSLRGFGTFNDETPDQAILLEAIGSVQDQLENANSENRNLQYLGLVVMILTLLVSAYYQARSVNLQAKGLDLARDAPTKTDIDKIVQAAEKSGTRIADSIASKAAGAENIRYIHGDSKLRLQPERDAVVVRYVYPDQILKVLDTKGHWALVEIIDYRTEKPVSGWIARNQLRIYPLN